MVIMRFSLFLLSALLATSGFAQTSSGLSPVSRGSLRSVLAPKHDLKLSSRAAGVVEKIHVAEGSPVKAGQAIISLDSQQEEAELAQAEAALRGIEADLERVTNEYERIAALFKDKISSDKQYEESRSTRKITESRRDQSRAAVELAKVRLDNRTVRSPIDGVFLKTVKSVGEAVERFEVIARIVDTSSLRFVIYGDYTLFGRYTDGQTVSVQVQSATQNDVRVSGTIEHIDPVIDATSGTFRIIVAIPPSPQATPGLSAMLSIGGNDSVTQK